MLITKHPLFSQEWQILMNSEHNSQRLFADIYEHICRRNHQRTHQNFCRPEHIRPHFIVLDHTKPIFSEIIPPWPPWPWPPWPSWPYYLSQWFTVHIPMSQKKNIQKQRTEHKGHCNTGSGRWQEDVSVMTICDECRHFHDDMWRAHAWPFFSEERWMLTRVAKSLMLHWSQMAPLCSTIPSRSSRVKWRGVG